MLGTQFFERGGSTRSRGYGRLWVGGGIVVMLTFVGGPIRSHAKTEPEAEAESPSVMSKRRDASSLANAPSPLSVTVEPAIDNAQLLPAWILERSAGAIHERVRPEREQVVVAIRGVTYDYEVETTPLRDGAPVSPPGKVLHCECSGDELLDVIDESIAGALDRLRESPPVSRFASRTLIVVEPPPRFTGVSTTGGVVGAVGLVALGGGGALMALENRPLGPLEGDILRRNYRAPGMGLVAAGIGALALGSTLIILDVTRCDRRPDGRRCLSTTRGAYRRAGAASAVISVTVGPAHAGATARGRF